MANIGWAVEDMRKGNKVARQGWGDMWIAIHEPDNAEDKMTLNYVFVRTEKGEKVPWLPNQADLLATDWGSA
jgi:hypothetical protein